jgi:hypothetical protein
VLERDAFIAYDLEMRVGELGASSVFVAASVEQALAIVAARAPDIALLDRHITGETADRLMAALQSSGVCGAIVSGDPSDAILLPENWIYLGKPVSDAELERGVGLLLKRRFGLQ